MAFLAIFSVVACVPLGGDDLPWIVIAEDGRIGRFWGLGSMPGCEVPHLLAHHPQQLLHVGDDLHEVGDGRVDCVPVHAALAISAYPRSSAPGTVLGFRRAPSRPPGAKVLRARLAVIARRAYGSIVHEDGDVGCLRRPPEAGPPG